MLRGGRCTQKVALTATQTPASPNTCVQTAQKRRSLIVKTLSEDDLLELLGPEPAPAPASVVAWSHQRKEFEEHRDDRCRALLWSMRTGKSKAVIDKAEYQFSKGAIEGVIVLAPNGVHINWVVNEIPRWSRPENGQPRAVAWEAPKRADWDRIAAFDALCAHTGGLKWLTINMEAFGGNTEASRAAFAAVRRFRSACHGRFMLALSEAHHFGHAGAKRTKLARYIGRRAKFITLETGTAILNSPLRWYSMAKIMDDNALGPEFQGDCYEKFVQRFAVIEDSDVRGKRKRRAYKKITGYRDLDTIRDLMANYASVVLREDIGDMPALISTERLVVMSEKQRRAYLEMVSRHLVELEATGYKITAADAGARMMKLQQILNGYIKDDKTIIEIDPDAPIYDALSSEVGGTLPGKSIVWCRYREDIRRVCKRLAHDGYRVLEFHGGVPTDKREEVRLAFQNDPSYTVLVGQPAAGGEGRDFSAADAIIFFSSTPNAIHYEQAKERGTLIAGHPVAIVRIRTPGTVDDRNWSIIDGKVSLADTVSGRGLRDLLRLTDV